MNDSEYILGSHAKSLISAHDDESSIRRACSLSDLSMGKGNNKIINSNKEYHCN